MAKQRIALLGPVLPFRGGIAQYTTQLHQALSEDVDLLTISFKRQYPKWLYPGSSDKDPDAPSKITGVHYDIDVYNPLSWRRAASDIAKQQCDLVILDWWTIFWQPGFAYIAHRLRKKGIKTAFLCHNLFDHDAKGIKRRMSELFLKQADAYIVQSSEQQALLHQVKPKAKSLLNIHPIYTRFEPAKRPLPKRGRLELLFFGFIRPYKGLDTLMAALAELKDSEVYVTVVGEPWIDATELRQKLQANGVPNLELRLEYVNDAEAANYFARADAAVLPYTSATGSGVVALAYNYGKPVIASSVGGLKDAVVDGKTGVLVPANDATALAAVIASARRDNLTAMKPAIEAFCLEHSWQNMSKKIQQFSKELNERH